MITHQIVVIIGSCIIINLSLACHLLFIHVSSFLHLIAIYRDNGYIHGYMSNADKLIQLLQFSLYLSVIFQLKTFISSFKLPK